MLLLDLTNYNFNFTNSQSTSVEEYLNNVRELFTRCQTIFRRDLYLLSPRFNIIVILNKLKQIKFNFTY